MAVKKLGILVLLILLMGSLCGCKKQQNITTAVVSSIDIIHAKDGRIHTVTFVEEGQMVQLLHRLRLLAAGDRTKEDPERYLCESCVIRVHLCDGSSHIYRHAGGRYLSVDSRPWRLVDPAQSQLLFGYLTQFHEKADR